MTYDVSGVGKRIQVVKLAAMGWESSETHYMRNDIWVWEMLTTKGVLSIRDSVYMSREELEKGRYPEGMRDMKLDHCWQRILEKAEAEEGVGV